jgi:excisionase family DNA binding protein
MPAVEPTAEDFAAVEAGALSVAQACAYTGDSRARLYELMDAGVLEWFSSGTHRRITKQSAQRYLARLLAEAKAQRSK